MEFSLDSYQSVVESKIAEWTRRSRNPFVSSKGPGCFIWDSNSDGIQGSGAFCYRDIVQTYFSNETAVGLHQVIDEADHSMEVVVVLIFDSKIICLRLAKSDYGQAKEVVPPLVLEEP